MISLPMPPSANNMFVNVPGRGRVSSKDYNDWRREAGKALEAYQIAHVARPYGVHIRLNLDHKSDIDNRVKAVLDLLVKHGIICGDQWVDTIRVDRDRTVPACSVEVWRIEA